MSELDPNEATTSTDLDPTTAVPVPTAPLIPTWGQGDAADGPSNPVPQPYEPAVAWAPAVPVAASAQPGRAHRWRWAAALAIVALVLGASAAIGAFITNSAATATVLGYVPADTLVYGELRLDLPGDQRAAAGEFLSKFPGFKDQAALESKLDEALDEMVKGITSDDQTYTTDIKPWFDGELAFSVGPLPPPASMQNRSLSSVSMFRGLVLMSVKDPALAQAWIDGQIAKTGVTTSKEPYGGTTLTVYVGQDSLTLAVAIIDGKVAVAGDVVSVKAAVDTKGSSDFAGEPGPSTALNAADSDHIGFVYMAIRPLVDWSLDLQKSSAAEVPGMVQTVMSEALLKTIPAWGAYWVRFEDDALVMEATAPKAERSIGATENRRSSLIEHIPSTAIVASVGNDLGATLRQTLDLYSSEPAFSEMLGQLDQALGLAGGRDAALGWIGDVAIVVNDAGTPEGGLLVTPTDPAAAERLLTSIKTLIGLGGGSQGITVREEPYAGTTITIVDLGDIAERSGMAPSIGGMPLTGHLEIAFAVTDDVVVIGSGPGFVKHVLDTTRATSLESDQQFKDAAGRTGPGTGATFVDITAIRLLIEKGMADADPSSLARYEADVKPFLVPFDAMFASSSIDGELTNSSVTITVK